MMETKVCLAKEDMYFISRADFEIDEEYYEPKLQKTVTVLSSPTEFLRNS